MSRLCSVMLVFSLAFAPVSENKLVCGAYIQKNMDYADSIAEYEELCGIKNSVYLINVKDEYPHEEALECYANGKTPMLLLSDNYSMGKVLSLAEEAGKYNMPLYLCIHGSLDFYRYCVGIFKIKAKNTKFVQAAALSDYSYTFAGTDMVDYLALNTTVGAGSNNYTFLYNAIEQADVPVIINLAISHYKEEDHRYYTYEKMKIMDYIYGMKEHFGDKLYGINYVNTEYKGQHFDVYSDEKLRTMYAGEICKWGIQN